MKTKSYFNPVWILVLFVMIFLTPSSWSKKGRIALNKETTAAFVNANVISMNNERILKNHTVIVKNGLIEQVVQGIL